MKIIWAGTGSAFAPEGTWQCQAVIVSDTGKNFLIDCGSDARHSLRRCGIKAGDIDAVYISHLHGDHVHGLEWLGFKRFGYGGRVVQRPKLFGISTILTRLWARVLSGTLESIEGKVNTFADYFDLRPVEENESFTWEGILFEPVQTVHVMNGRALTDSFGVLVTDEQGTKVFFTTDTQHCPTQITASYNQADIVFHDCETSSFASGVHAHYTQLVTLSPATKAKTYLIHYMPDDEDGSGPYFKPEQAVADGFRGFVAPGTVFDLAGIRAAEESRR